MACATAAPAAVYKWVDAQGKVEYGDQPPEGVHAELVALKSVQSAPSGTYDPPSSGGTAAPATPSAPPAAASAPPAASAGKSDAAKKVQEDVAQTREKQCGDAQDRYKKLIEGRRLYKTGADGEREYLTSAQIDSERINAKLEVDAACNDAT